MKNTKKGFTLVELLVVIAIVAILATVAIIGYTSFIDKANESADIYAARELNTILEALVGDDRPDDIDELFATLNEMKDIDLNNYKPMAKDAKYYWVQSLNCIIYVNAKGEVVFPENVTSVPEDAFELATAVSDAKDLVALLNGGSGVVSLNGTIDVAESSLGYYGGTRNMCLYISPDKDTVLTGGKIVTDGNSSEEEHSWGTLMYLKNSVDMTIKDTTIEGSVDWNFQCRVDTGSILTLDDVIVSSTNGCGIYVFGDSSTLVGGEVIVNADITQTGLPETAPDYAACALATARGINVTITGGTYTSQKYALYLYNSGSTVTVEDGTFNGNVQVPTVATDDLNNKNADAKCFLTINGGTFNGTISVANGSTAVLRITGGTFTGNLSIGANADVEITGGIFSVDPSNWVADGYVANQNADNTWTVVAE